MDDVISRQAAIDALNKKKIYRPLDSDRWVISDCLNAIVNLPSAQSERTDCTDCPDYDHDTHSCPKYCDVIRQTVEEAKQERKTGRWILHENQRQEDVDNGNYLYICSECGKSDIHAKTQEVPYCWWCGARMEGES